MVEKSSQNLQENYENYELRTIEILALVFVFVFVLLLSYFLIFIDLFSLIWQIQLENTYLFPVATIAEVLAFFIFLLIPSLVVASITEYLANREVHTSKESKPPLIEQREKVLEYVSPNKLESLDEYWEIVVVIIVVIVIAISLVNSALASVGDWTQILVTVIFWASYKTGKAKHSIDLRLLSIASISQFIVLLSSIYGMAWGIEIVVMNWLAYGAPLDVGIPFASAYWLLLFYFTLFLGSIFVYISKPIGQIIAKHCFNWIRKTDDIMPNDVDQTAMYLVTEAMPPYLFYGTLWFLIMLIPTVEYLGVSLYFIGLIQATLIVIIILVLGWITRILFSQSQLVGRKFTRGVSIIMTSGGYVKKITQYGASSFLLAAIFLMLPTLTFSSIMLSGAQALVIANALNGAIILMFVHVIGSFNSKSTE